MNIYEPTPKLHILTAYNEAVKLVKKRCQYYDAIDGGRYCLECKSANENNGALYCTNNGQGVFKPRN